MEKSKAASESCRKENEDELKWMNEWMSDIKVK